MSPRMRFSCLPASILCVLLCAISASTTLAEELPPNGTFDTVVGGKPTGWHPEIWVGKPEFTVEKGRAGGAVAVSGKQGVDGAWQTNLPVLPHSTYRLSGWIKTRDVSPKNGRGALLNLHNLQGVATKAISGTSDWTKVETVFETGPHDSIQLNCLLGGWGTVTGKAWFDDISLKLLKKGEFKPEITVDAAKKGEPLSKYVYGQFIEHLGRCIYGGIWAEMLEDRKFYYGVGEKESPWMAIGKVAMSNKKPFVGKQDPVVALPGGKPAGIVQDALGLVAGKEYVGRIWLSGTSDAAPVEVRLIWGDGKSDCQVIRIGDLSSEFAKTPLKFTAQKSTDDGRLEITSLGKGSFRIGTVSLMPADNIDGMRPDTLALLKELDAPLYRWPGGNFVSGYDWRDGIGDPDKRPPRKNPAWLGVEHNDFGINEFMTFCRYLGTEPLVVVNTGFGDPHSAAREVEYANASTNTPMGRKRAEHGHAEPYAVKWWGIGNEMYGGWQLGHMKLDHYVIKHNETVDRMREVDPDILTVGVGNVGPWTDGMLRRCSNHMDHLSEHFYCQERNSVYEHVRQIPDAIRHKAEAHREYRKTIGELKGKNIRIAMDEWNYWYGPHVFGELGTRYFLKDALGIAAGINEYARQSDIVFMANYAQTVNVIGCIKTNKTAAAFAATGLVLKLYRKHFGQIPVEVKTSYPLDAAAAWTADGKALTLSIVNPTAETLTVPVDIKGVSFTGKGTVWTIAGPDPKAYNEPGKPERVRIEESDVPGVGKTVEVKPYSVTLYRLETRS